jgi:hypothetical protein
MEVDGHAHVEPHGILCICNAFKDMVKVTFINGAKLGDVDGLFNAEKGVAQCTRR